jgi:hypothetical protein
MAILSVRRVYQIRGGPRTLNIIQCIKKQSNIRKLYDMSMNIHEQLDIRTRF